MRIALGAVTTPTCGSFTNWLCTYLNATGPTCQACAVPAPTINSASTVPGGVPAGYDPITGTVTEPSDYTAGNLPSLTAAPAYTPVYPNINQTDQYDYVRLRFDRATDSRSKHLVFFDVGGSDRV